MSKEELEKHYAKKPKRILVMDCVYLESERRSERDKVRDLESRISRLDRDLDVSKRKSASLQDSMGHLIKALEALKNQVGI